MKMFKKTLTLLLAVVMTLSCFVGMTVTASAATWQNAMPGAHSVAINISEKTYGYRAVINQEFNEFGFYLPTWGVTTGTYCSIALYKWDETYQKTLEGTPIVSQTFNPMNNSRLRVKFYDNPVPAGEYLFYVYDTCSANCGLFVYQGATDVKGISYLNGVVTYDFIPDLVVYTPDEIAGELFGMCDPPSEEDFPPVVAATSANVLGSLTSNTPSMVDIGWTYGYRTKVNFEFSGFGFRMPTWQSKAAYCTLALYKWDTDYATTIAGEPVVTKRFDPMTDNARNKVEFDAQPAGEYLFYIYDTSYKNCGIYMYQASGFTNPFGYSYINEVEVSDRIPDLEVYAADEFSGNPFDKCEPQEVKFNDAEYTPVRDKTPTFDEMMSNIIIEGACAVQFEELYNQEYFDMMGAAHFDLAQIHIGSDRNTTEELAIKSFELANKAGIGVHIYEKTVPFATSQENIEALYAYIDKWRNLTGFGQIYFVDEPMYPNDVASTVNVMHKYAPNMLININHFGYAVFQQYGNRGYYDVLDDYCRLLENKDGLFLGLDDYPFPPSPNSLSEYSLFYNLNQCRLAGLENDIKTSFYPLSVGSNDYGYRKPSGSELRYHVNSGLAYGMKKIAYWTYGSSVFEHRPFYTTAIVDRYGYPTDLYYAVSEVNRQTHAIGKTLVNLDALEVYHSGDSGFDRAYEAYDHIPENFFAKTDDYAILSLMKHKETGRNYLMIVNKDFTNAQEISINFSDVAVLKEISNENGEEIDVAFENGVFTRTLEAGAAVLLALPEGKDYTKPETVVESDNLIANAYVSASNSYGQDNYYINRVFDGITEATETSKGWKAITAEKDAQWLKIDLGEVKGFDRLVLYPGDSASERFFPKNVTLLTSDDGENWTTVTEKSVRLSDGSATLEFDAAFGRYVRVEFDGLTRDTSNGNKYTCVLGEVELFNDSGAVPPVQDEETTTPDGETTAPDSGEETTTPDAETTITPDADTTATPADDTTAAPEDGTAGADATAEDTTAAEASGCKASLGAGIAAAALIAAAGAVVLKKKED